MRNPGLLDFDGFIFEHLRNMSKQLNYLILLNNSSRLLAINTSGTSKYRANCQINQQSVATFPTDGVKKIEWVSGAKNPCRSARKDTRRPGDLNQRD